MDALATWRDVALIILSLEAFLITLGAGAVLYFSLRGLQRLQILMGPYFPRVHLYVYRIRRATLQIMKAITAPFLWLHSIQAGLRQTFNTLARR